MSLGLHKDVKATEEVCIPQKRTSSTSKLKISPLLWAIFALLGMRIRIQPTKMIFSVDKYTAMYSRYKGTALI
jgi:hypothetical protein